MTAVTTILHAGEDFVLHHHRGRGRYLLVTFMHSHQEHTADSEYLLRTFAERHEIPCLGIACRTRNFYTSDEIEQVLAAAAPIVAGFETVVLVGNSIGGYAALKHSRRLRATHVLAVAPPWSLDLEALRFDDPAQRERLAADLVEHGVSAGTLAGMAIRQDELSGRIVVVHNPLSAIDNHQMDHLHRALTLPEVLPLQQDGHNVFPMLERANVIATIIDLLRFADAAELRRAFRSFRRSTPGCVVPMLQQAVRRHPLLVHRALRGPTIAATPQLAGLDQGRVSGAVAFQLARAGHAAPALERIEQLARRGLGRSVRLSVGATAAPEPGAHHLLLSVHGTMLCATTGVSPRLALSADPFGSDELRPVFATVREREMILQTMTPDGIASAPLALREARSWSYEIGAVGTVALSTETGFLLAGPDDGVRHGAPVDFQESFLLLGVADPATLSRRRAADWLELSASRGANTVSARADPIATRTVRRGAGLATLFGRFGLQARS